MSLLQQVRGYTFSGWTITAIIAPVFLFAGAYVVLQFLGQGDSPGRFFELTGYPSYLAFVVLGVAFNGLAVGALEDGGNAIYEEESNGTWDLLSLAPFDRFVWMFAKTLASLLTGFIDFFAVLALGALVFSFSPTWGGLAVAFLGIVGTLVALQGLGFLMAALGLIWKQPYALAFLLAPALILLSGMMFPVQALPEWLRPLSNLIPLTHGLSIVRDALLLDRSLVELLPAFGRLALSGAIFMGVGFAAFKFMETKARELGVLGRY
jgi:ABC-2 type transport system permease protein